MATLVAIGYPDEGTAEQARQTVFQLEEELIIQADEVASISRDLEGKYHVHTSHGGTSAGGAVWGGFWGLLFGLLFFIPFAGSGARRRVWARCSATSARRGSTRRSSSRCAPTCSPVPLRCSWLSSMTPDKAIAALEQYGGTVIKTSLSDEDTKKLQDALTPPTAEQAG